MTPAIRAEALGKQYRIGASHHGRQTLREALAGLFSRPASRAETIWAVRDLSFEVQRGEALGIVGRNGAGKSTLLKILSRITRPTTGRALLRGRLTSLLEIGTGFHPDLTGRENVFLNGAILGMSGAQIRGKFDAIVAFAELEQFIDTPVKHYSSGMYMRLAFAVAAHLEPEILILDEVLSVGDAAFQQKCQAFIDDIVRRGCTIVLVSHNLQAIANLCSRALFLDRGTLCADGPVHDVVGRYLTLVAPQTGDGECRWPDPDAAPGSDRVRLHAVRIVSGGTKTSRADVRAPLQIEVEYWNRLAGARIYTSIHLLEQSGVGVLATANLPSFNLGTDAWHGKPQPAGLFRSTCTLPAELLNENRYSISVDIVSNMERTEVAVHNVLSFEGYDADPRREYNGVVMGVIRPRLAWQTELLPAG
jgi:lipopolysaccharide transport system ATP-binding protein